MRSFQAGRWIGFVAVPLSVFCGPILNREVCAVEGDPRIEDFSDFTRFVFRVEGCLISLDEIVMAEIRRMNVTDFALTLSVATEGTEGVDSCLPWASAPGIDCIREELLAERLLTETEVATLLPAFSNLVVESQAHVLCAVCGVVTFTWDGVLRHDSPCYSDFFDFQSGQRLHRLLRRLRRGSADCNENGEFDALDIFGGSSVDLDGDGAPDECTSPMFLRGDCNADGKLDVTDPIANLSFQFVGTFDPPCRDALDFDDSGEVDISDPIANLTHQFLGGPPPAPPGKDACGVDPTADQLTCDNFAACAGGG